MGLLLFSNLTVMWWRSENLGRASIATIYVDLKEEQL